MEEQEISFDEIVKEVEIFTMNQSTNKGNRWSVSVKDIARTLPEGFVNTGPRLIVLDPGAVAGNHSHDDHEAISALCPGAILVWIDHDGKRHEKEMYIEGVIRIFIIYSNTPHAVLNKSGSRIILFELGEENHRNIQIEILLNVLKK